MVSDSEKTSANKILGDLHQLLNIKSNDSSISGATQGTIHSHRSSFPPQHINSNLFGITKKSEKILSQSTFVEDLIFYRFYRIAKYL